MSITFQIRGQKPTPQPGDRLIAETPDLGQYTFRTGIFSETLDPVWSGEIMDSDGYLAYIAVKPCWEDCNGRWYLNYNHLELNVSNVNGSEILNLLGIYPEPVGSIRGRDLLARCDRAIQSPAIQTDDALGRPESTQGRAISMARRPGYLRQRLNTLRRIAIAAGDLGVILWG